MSEWFVWILSDWQPPGDASECVSCGVSVDVSASLSLSFYLSSCDSAVQATLKSKRRRKESGWGLAAAPGTSDDPNLLGYCKVWTHRLDSHLQIAKSKFSGSCWDVFWDMIAVVRLCNLKCVPHCLTVWLNAKAAETAKVAFTPAQNSCLAAISEMSAKAYLFCLLLIKSHTAVCSAPVQH